MELTVTFYPGTDDIFSPFLTSLKVLCLNNRPNRARVVCRFLIGQDKIKKREKKMENSEMRNKIEPLNKDTNTGMKMKKRENVMPVAFLICLTEIINLHGQNLSFFYYGC